MFFKHYYNLSYVLTIVDGGVQRAPKFIATATLFKFLTLGNTRLCHKDIVWSDGVATQGNNWDKFDGGTRFSKRKPAT